MATVIPHWTRPSHSTIQEVVEAGRRHHPNTKQPDANVQGCETQTGEKEESFTTYSISRIALPPFGLFAPMSFPPCTLAPAPTYATVQFGRDQHLNLNSDLLYINHSCEPSLIFDTTSLNILAGPKGLKPGDELTFFYPSTEWFMAQPFDCLCRTPSCRGRIAGAGQMDARRLEGMWFNEHVRQLLREREEKENKPGEEQEGDEAVVNGNGSARRGLTSRELSGEMGGDT